MRKQSVYLDTSVISHLQADDAVEKMNATLELWEELKQGIYDVFVSEIVMLEVSKCSEPKKTFLMESMGQLDYKEISIDAEILKLANKYIEEGVLPPKSRYDALHIAVASVYECDILLSWDFGHILRLKTIQGVNGINKYMGYGEIALVSPFSIVGEE